MFDTVFNTALKGTDFRDLRATSQIPDVLFYFFTNFTDQIILAN